MQTPSAVFKRFEQRLREGKHVFFVDVRPAQEAVLQQVVSLHPQLRAAGTGSAAPEWAVAVQHRLHRLRKMI